MMRIMGRMKVTKTIRRLDLALAQVHAAAGRHEQARELFAAHGISYVPAAAPTGSAS